MIEKVYLSPDEDENPCILEYNKESDLYLVTLPNKLWLNNLIDLVEELKRITEYEE